MTRTGPRQAFETIHHVVYYPHVFALVLPFACLVRSMPPASLSLLRVPVYHVCLHI